MKNLSKSQYVRGSQCVKSLWLYRHARHLQTPVDAEQQAIFDAGTEFGILAQRLFPHAKLITADHRHPEEAVAQTQAAIMRMAHEKDAPRVLFEADFLHEGVLIRADVVSFTSAGVHLYEVKSTTEIKDVFMLDVAIQRYVMSGAGHPVARAFIMHANPEYVRQGPLDVTRLVSTFDATAESQAQLQAVPAELARMKQVDATEKEPGTPIGAHCTKPYPCDFKSHCWAHVPAYSVFNLAGARMDKKLELWNSGVKTVAQIPRGTKLTTAQGAQVAVAQAGAPTIDRRAVATFLGTLAWPRYFLDFETDNPVVPPFDGLRPYQQMPFQASLHVQDGPEAPLRHYEFLGDGIGDPRRELIQFLLQLCGERGSVIAYNKSFEGGCIKELAPLLGGHARELLAIEGRLWDLAEPFRKAQYVHPDFRGSWSIKKVLPVLVPDMTYKGLQIDNGAAAQIAYRQLRKDIDQGTREDILAALKIYCGQDTLAMVKILAHLEAAAVGTGV